MIVGIDINKTESRRHIALEELPRIKNVNIRYDVNLNNAEVVKTSESHEVLRVRFVVSIDFSPSLGYMRFEGFCDYSAPINLQQVKKDWDAGKANPDINDEVSNSIFIRLAPLSMLISQNMSMPPTLPIPSAQSNRSQPAVADDKFDQYHG